jgi:hypothetical protein
MEGKRRETTLVSAAAKLGQRAKKARALYDLYHSRSVSGNLFPCGRWSRPPGRTDYL